MRETGGGGKRGCGCYRSLYRALRVTRPDCNKILILLRDIESRLIFLARGEFTHRTHDDSSADDRLSAAATFPILGACSIDLCESDISGMPAASSLSLEMRNIFQFHSLASQKSSGGK